MIDLKRNPETGDYVRFSTIHDLMPFDRTGIIELQTPYAARISVDGGGTIDVPLRDIVTQITEEQALEYCLKMLNLIAAQEQGAGGSTTEAEAWRSAKRIALETVNMLSFGKR